MGMFANPTEDALLPTHSSKVGLNPARSTGATLVTQIFGPCSASTVSPPAIAGGNLVGAASNTSSTIGANSATPLTITSTSSANPFEGGAAGNQYSQCGLLGLIGLIAMALTMI